MRGVQPPPLGSVKSSLFARMFLMEQTQTYDAVSTLGMVMAASNSVDRSQAEKVLRIITNFADSVGFKKWSNSAKQEKKARELTDQDLLEKVSKLGEK